MRMAWFVVLALAVGTLGCKDKGEAGPAKPDPAVLKAQQELMARRDALLSARNKLQADRDQIDVKIKEVAAAGGDTSELAKQRADLDKKLEGQTSELIQELSSKADTINTAGDATSAIASREASMSGREKGVASREAQLAAREAQLAEREKAQAQREKETCSGGGTMTIVQAPARPGEKYTKKDVEPLLSKARATMAKKGLIGADLPGPVAGLEGEATKAMGEGDWGRAYLAASQLAGTVDAIKIDRAFITAKYARLNSRVTGGKYDEATTAQLTDGMREVLQKYGDGDFGAANRRLNQLAGLVK